RHHLGNCLEPLSGSSLRPRTTSTRPPHGVRHPSRAKRRDSRRKFSAERVTRCLAPRRPHLGGRGTSAAGNEGSGTSTGHLDGAPRGGPSRGPPDGPRGAPPSTAGSAPPPPSARPRPGNVSRLPAGLQARLGRQSAHPCRSPCALPQEASPSRRSWSPPP